MLCPHTIPSNRRSRRIHDHGVRHPLKFNNAWDNPQVENMESDLQDLIAVPRETLGIELKAWLDLTDKTVRANIARHVAALANHGGGYMVLGLMTI